MARLTLIAVLIILVVSVDAKCQEVTHTVERPGVGHIEQTSGNSFDVTKTSDGYLIQMAFVANQNFQGTFSAVFKSDGWTRLVADIVDTPHPVEVLFHPYGTEGPYTVREGSSFNLQPRDWNYSIGLRQYDDCLTCAPQTATFEYSVIPIESPLPGDFNFDNRVDFKDFSILRENFRELNRTWKDGDATLDELVDFADFQILSVNYGAVREHVAAVPEPSALLLFASACVCRHRRVRKP